MFSDLTTPLLHLEVFVGVENSQLMQASSLRCKVPLIDGNDGDDGDGLIRGPWFFLCG